VGVLALVLVALLALVYAGYWVTTSGHPGIEFARVIGCILVVLVLLAANVIRFTVHFVRAEVRQW
jgi:hypothetical protein